ncbi:MAG: hypothetical protein WDN08_04745 [Rhizomicrobium sp.]
MDWATMNPRKTGRFCGDCKKVVQDLSSMREADAKQRVAAAPEGLCIRYLHDEHGNIWFKDTPLLSPGSLLKRGATLAAVALMPMLSACMGSAELSAAGLRPDASEPQTPDVPNDRDAGSNGRAAAEPVVGDDAGADAAADAEPEPDPDAGEP